MKHTKGPWLSYRRGAREYTIEFTDGKLRSVLARIFGSELCSEHQGTAENNAQLLALAPTAPHDCDDPQCPGAVNKRKLEAQEKTDD